MPFCCVQHLSDVQAIFPAFAANSIVPVATIYSHLSDVQAIFPAFAANSIVPVATIYSHLSDERYVVIKAYKVTFFEIWLPNDKHETDKTVLQRRIHLVK